jgi:CDP-diacylglycerol--serine O-phosphatidyltransferase
MTPDPDTNRHVRKRGIYLLPNLFTTGSLFAGFYSIISGMNQDFISAAIAIFIALIFDGLDGRVARLINAQSAFGAQYDSLADMLSFGVAPALLAYNWNSLYLDPIGWSKLAWLSAFVFSACVALRLARFNVQLEAPVDSKKAKRYFYGVPCPAAAAVVASLIWVCNLHGYEGLGFSLALVIVMLLASYLMVSNIYFRSFKDIDLKKNIRFTYLVLIIFMLAGIVFRPAEALCIIFALFLLSGPVGSLFLLMRKKTHGE